MGTHTISLSVDTTIQQDMPLIPDLDDMDVFALNPESVYSSPQWLQRWLQATQGAPIHCQVPSAASVITTPLVPLAWRSVLISHPHRALVHFFLHGITTGFQIGYNLPSTALKSAKKNMTSAYDHAAVDTDYLAAELAEGHVVGPFPPFMVPNAHIMVPNAHPSVLWSCAAFVKIAGYNGSGQLNGLTNP